MLLLHNKQLLKVLPHKLHTPPALTAYELLMHVIQTDVELHILQLLRVRQLKHAAFTIMKLELVHVMHFFASQPIQLVRLLHNAHDPVAVR